MKIVVEIDNHDLRELLDMAEQNKNLKFTLNAEQDCGWNAWTWDIKLPEVQ